MKIIYLVISVLFIIIGQLGVCQTDPNAPNLVPNPGFEFGNNGAVPGCSNHYSPGGSIHVQGMNNFNNDLYGWKVAQLNPGFLGDNGTPDWIDPSCNEYVFPGNSTRFVHMATEIENLRIGLVKNGIPYSLIGGRRYVVKYKYKLESGSGCLRFFFTKWGEHWNSNSNNNQKWEAINANLVWTTSTFEWVEEVRTFIAPMGDNFSNLSNLILRLCDDSGGAVYTKLLIDDVQLFEEDPCADIRAVENTIYWNETNIYQANIDLYAGLTVNQHTIDGPVVVKYNSNIIYRAGNQVVLEPGFSTEPGCYFEAVIGPCENNPCPAPPFIPQSLELCGNTTVVLGPTSPPDVGLLFSWSPATYLDNPNSPNPTFTAPSGVGTMNYTLTVTSVCGYLFNPPFSFEQQLNYPVSIYYNDNPDPNPVLSLSNIQQSHMVFSMDAQVGPSTEKVCISLTDVSTGQVIATECFYADSDFDCCSFSFSNFDFSDATRLLIDPCKDYQVSVQVNNKCDANLATQSFLWNNDPTFSLVVLPNVITPNSDGVNDSWRVQATGVKRYEVEVRDINQRVYFATDIVNSFDFKIWDGICNQGWPACNPGSPCLSDGTYFYILNLIDCNNVVHDYTGFITLLDGTPNGCLNPRAADVSGNQQAEMNPEAESFLSTENQEIAVGLHLFPNPSDGRLTIVHDHLMGEIQILDVSGRLVKSTSTSGSQTHLELGYLSNGHYLIKLHDQEGKVYFARWVKQ